MTHSVLHVHAGNLFGGIEVMLLTLLAHGGEDLRQDVALSFDDTFAARLRAEGREPGILGAVRISRPWTGWRARRRLRRRLGRDRPDAVVVHSVWGIHVFGRAARRAGLPLVAWLHAPPTGDQPLDRLARRTPPDLIIANSAFTQAAVPRLYPDVPVRMIHPPVPAPSGEADGTAVRAAEGVPENVPLIIQVARMEPGKGQQVLLEALAGLTGAWTCWLVGGAQRAEERQHLARLEHRARELGIADRVRFLGPREDARTLIAAADILVHPNIEPESFGMVFVEAMRAGVPVVASAMGGALEVVADDAGVLLPPGDIGELRDVLNRLVGDAELRHGMRGGPARARTLADPAAQARRFGEAVRDVLH